MSLTLADARRVVIKVGSSSLTTPAGAIDDGAVARLVDAVAALRGRGCDVVLVSSGAIAAGLAPLGLRERPRDLALQQAAASVGQGLLVHRYTAELARHGITVGQVLLTADDVTRRGHYRNALRTLDSLLDVGALPVVNENDTVATSEIRFGDNDRLAALVAHLVRADVLVLLTDIDGVYDRPPSDPTARLIREVDSDDDLSGITVGPVSAAGTGGIATKIEAARIANAAGVCAVVASAERVGDLLAGRDCPHTTFVTSRGRRRSRQLWLAHASEAKGVLVLDDGAVDAVRHRGTSLLPAGVVGAHGTFEAGDPVDLADRAGCVFARGLVNYDAREVPRLLGRRTTDLVDELGEAYDRELVHRDHLVVL